MMDPCGPQKKIKSNEYHASFEKLINGGGAKSDYKGGLTIESTHKKSSSGQAYDADQGTTKGATKHTYGVDGKGDSD